MPLPKSPAVLWNTQRANRLNPSGPARRDRVTKDESHQLQKSFECLRQMPFSSDPSWICDLTTTMAVVEICTRGLTFDTGDPEFPYSLGGSCFVARFRRKYFVLTARHCLNERRPEQALISVDQETAAYLPIRRLVIPQAPTGQDPGAADVAFLKWLKTV